MYFHNYIADAPLEETTTGTRRNNVKSSMQIEKKDKDSLSQERDKHYEKRHYATNK